jgi:hypothetical protein
VIGLDLERANQYSVGIGGPIAAYYLDSLSGRAGATPLQSWGPPRSLSPGAHSLLVSVKGQSLDFEIDGVPIFRSQLPSPLIGEQLGVLALGNPGIRFEHVEVERAHSRVFVVMHFDSPFDELYAEVIVPVCEELGLDARRADELKHPGVILHDIVNELVEAAVVVAEITPENPNAFYEVGYAHAIDKPTILLAQRGTDLPFDISGFRVIFYDDSIGGKPLVERELRSHLTSILGIPGSVS